MQHKPAFENQLISGLDACGVNLDALAAGHKALGAAVSGGADSVSLLVGLCSVCSDYSIPLKVITVNHFIRQDAETCGDAEYVQDLCASLKNQGYDVSCTVWSLKRGQVEELSAAKGCGIEAAARELRYNAFEAFIKENNLDFLCLAHNKNDQTETLLMRFLQGSANGGIPCVRGAFVRPLLWTDRNTIEEYLNSKKIGWRTDSTNSDTAYLRNRIRNNLIPLLNRDFAGWDNAVLLGLEKEHADNEYLNRQAEEFLNKGKERSLSLSKGPDVPTDYVSFPGPDFYALDRAIKLRVLTLAMNALGVSQRIPYVFLRDVCNYADNYNRRNNTNSGESTKRFAGICIALKKEEVLIKKAFDLQNEIVFSVIIKESGMYELPFGQVFVPDCFDFPVMLRSSRLDDVVRTADGGTKKVNDVLSDWHVEQPLRNCIPVVQALNEPEQKILCILGSCLGYSDWIVKLDNENESK